MTVPEYTSHTPLRIGTRRSPLALAQAEMAAAAIRQAHNLEESAVILVPMLSSGDKIQDRPLAEIGGKALWTKELERALIEDDIDIAVHSMKDVETVRSPLFKLSAMLPRADVRDRLIGVTNLDDLRPQAVIGTSSPRRAAQLKAMRPDLETRPIRGNVATRMAQVAAGEFDATLLAAAGLDRLGQPDVGTSLPLETMLPAAAQGAIGIDHLASRDELAVFLQAVNHPATFTAVTAERAFLEALGGNCHSPVAAHATCNADTITLRGEILSEDGSERHSGILEFVSDDHEGPARLAHALLEKAGDRLRHLFAP
ncbi:hydroxymethylbilane synthase [Sphingorhabdus contaminans]|uniref:Porphobilinogen deaminase n=1 Tax=Sphingorhabdus contaminans TaxID=1343899 RepID=A0A553WC95_9SPHN|nr:hydroxymethylbilane synthase [Sphingorhabdus contaminans]TSB02311.1 hydroxymethylbilane synthase [Sphingorhabdus contaminans]